MFVQQLFIIVEFVFRFGNLLKIFPEKTMKIDFTGSKLIANLHIWAIPYSPRDALSCPDEYSNSLLNILSEIKWRQQKRDNHLNAADLPFHNRLTVVFPGFYAVDSRPAAPCSGDECSPSNPTQFAVCFAAKHLRWPLPPSTLPPNPPNALCPHRHSARPNDSLLSISPSSFSRSAENPLFHSENARKEKNSQEKHSKRLWKEEWKLENRDSTSPVSSKTMFVQTHSTTVCNNTNPTESSVFFGWYF